MKKKALLIITILIVILTTTVMATNVLPDTDSRVVMLKQNGILIGDENGNLNLNQSLKRQEMVVLISRLMGKEQEAKNWDTTSLTFQDVAKDDWAAGYIAWAKDNSITKGYSDEWFGYDDGLTATQTQIFLLRVLGNLEAEMYNANDLANNLGLMKGIINIQQEQIIRSDVAIMLYNTLEIEKNVKEENVFYNASNSIMNFIDKAYEEYENSPNVVSNKGRGILNLELNTQMTDEYKEAEKLNGMEATILSQMDIEKEILKMALNLKQNTNEFIDGELIIDSENLYFKIKDIIDKYVYDSVGYNMFAEFAAQNIGNEESITIIKDIYDDVKLDIIDVLSKEQISKQEVKTLINGKEVFATKNTIKMNTKLTDKLMLIIYKELINNNELINYYVETTNASYESWGEWGESFKVTAKEVKEEIQNEIDSITDRIKENEYDYESDMVLNIYTTGLLNKPVKYEIEDSDYDEQYSLVLFEDNIEFRYSDTYFDNSSEELAIRLNRKDTDKWYFEFAINGYEENEKYDQFLITANTNKINTLITDIEYNINLIDAKEEIYKANGNIAICLNTASEDYLNMSGVFELNRDGNKVNIKFGYEYDEKFELDDNYKDNAIYYEDIDEIELQEIGEKLEALGEKLVPYSDGVEKLLELMFIPKESQRQIETAKLATFYNDISTVQSEVTLKMLTNVAEMETKDWMYGTTEPYGKYVGILPETVFNSTIENVNGVNAGNLIPGKGVAILNIEGQGEVEVYQLDANAANELDLFMSEEEIQNFAIDKDGKVYFYKGLILDYRNPTVANVTRDLTITATSESINILDY